MKRNIFAIIVMALVGLVFVSCEKSVTEIADVPQLAVSESLSVDAAGGSFTCSYSLFNPVDGGTLDFGSDKSWITDVSANSSGQISFTVGRNTNNEIRSGNVTVSYSYDGAFIQKKVGVIQSGYGNPEIVLAQSVVTVSSGGGAYSISYDIVNPMDDGVLTCTANGDWIEELDFSSAGIIRFAFGTNEDSDLRYCEITATYSWQGGSVSGKMAVVQDFIGSTSFDGTIESLFGKWEAVGYAYDLDNGGGASLQTWTMTFYDGGYGTYGDRLIAIDGACPAYVGTFPATEGYIAYAQMDNENQFIITSQLTGYILNSSGYWIGYIPCLKYVAGTGWSYNANLTAGDYVTFTYNPMTDAWSSDYGFILCTFAVDNYYNPTKMEDLLDIVNPGIVITKVSDDNGGYVIDSVGEKSLSGPFDPEHPVIHQINDVRPPLTGVPITGITVN